MRDWKHFTARKILDYVCVFFARGDHKALNVCVVHYEANETHKSGYATAKNYAEAVTLLIETYELWRVDYELF